MNVTEAIRIALQSLWANKLRSVLTLLGVVIGVAAVIAVVTFVNGINGYVAEKIFRLGTDVFIVFKVSPAVTNVDHFLDGEKRKDLNHGGLRGGPGSVQTLPLCGSLAAQSERTCEVQRAVHRRYLGAGADARRWRRSSTSISRRAACSTKPTCSTARHVAVIGTDIVENLMPGVDPIGKEIRVDGWSRTKWSGVGEKKGKTLGQSLDNYVMIPITAYLKQYGVHNNSIRISGKASGRRPSLEAAMDEARAVLRARRHDLLGADDSFDVETNASLLGIWSNLSGTFFVAMIGIAAISLIVGGIVIMNIMLVSVTERTREIGIRKAMGARRADVLLQFLIESATMAVVGGALGVFVRDRDREGHHRGYRHALGNQAVGGRRRL